MLQPGGRRGRRGRRRRRRRRKGAGAGGRGGGDDRRGSRRGSLREAGARRDARVLRRGRTHAQKSGSGSGSGGGSESCGGGSGLSLGSSFGLGLGLGLGHGLGLGVGLGVGLGLCGRWGLGPPAGGACGASRGSAAIGPLSAAVLSGGRLRPQLPRPSASQPAGCVGGGRDAPDARGHRAAGDLVQTDHKAHKLTHSRVAVRVADVEKVTLVRIQKANEAVLHGTQGRRGERKER